MSTIDSRKRDLHLKREALFEVAGEIPGGETEKIQRVASKLPIYG